MLEHRNTLCYRVTLALLAMWCGLASQKVCSGKAGSSPGVSIALGRVDHARVEAALKETGQWLVAGSGYANQHFSALEQINKTTVADLGVAWAQSLDTPIGVVAEPIVVDGVAFVSEAFSIVHAIDARSGKRLWTYDPRVNLGANLGASIISRTNRGVAVWDGMVYVGTADCRIVALDATRGTLIWETVVCNAGEADGAAISAAPRVGDGKVFTGYAGAELGVRGSVVALDASTGEELWRFWTVPGTEKSDTENAAMSLAAGTWSGGTAPMGGGVVWDGITYDHESGLLLFGTAGSLPYSYKKRESEGGDNLFTSSVVAVDANTGEYVWHYQTVPQDTWDYDACMTIIVAEQIREGKSRRVAMTAPKNGFFYSLDVENGKLFAADPIVPVSWAFHVDLGTGRPAFVPEARYFDFPDQVTRVFPGVTGAHNWQAMAYSHLTGLVYVPANELGSDWGIHENGEGWYDASGYSRNGEVQKNLGRLIAWDPLRGEARWSKSLKQTHNGGTLATSGGLVFLGETTGDFRAYDDSSGEALWSYRVGPAISGNPVSYEVDGEQYVLIAVGAGTIVRFTSPELTQTEDNSDSWNGLVAFRLGADATLPGVGKGAAPIPQPFTYPIDLASARRGRGLWKLLGCGTCHGMTAAGNSRRSVEGDIPDLRYLPETEHRQWLGILFGGRKARGMPAFNEFLNIQQAKQLQHYVLSRAWDGYCHENRNSPEDSHPYCSEHSSVQFMTP